ncbi:hypothetical protein JCGZ_20949 [Jatropha curcas]|uniref:Aminotransferase-like plant mobile domain-containing protein n=1 Tax=Jatropha curcas TaxID=180498 RepID=A0A067JTA6_JATCU|nr:hypothetical protein JCGZ_20949 [Jatropha curcas]
MAFLTLLLVWSYEYCIYPGGDSPVESRRIPCYLAHCHHTYASGEVPEYWRSFLNDQELSDVTVPDSMGLRGYWVDRYFLGERVFDTPVAPAQRRVPHAPPRHMCIVEGLTREDLEAEYRGFSVNDFLSVGDFPSYFASQMQARLPEILEYIQERKTHKTAAHYRAEAAAEVGGAAALAGPAGVVLGDVPFPPGPGCDLAEIVALCPVYLPDGINTDQGLPLEPFLNKAWALDKLSLLLSVPARLIPTYGPANFRSRTRGHFDFGDNPTIRWTCPWWRIRLVTIGNMNLNYVLYASLDRSMAYFPDRISRQYGMIQRVPRIHNFESGLITPHLLANLADRWRNRNTRYLGEEVMQDTVTPEYVNWFFTS